jgi:TRAP-type C4-dicarboxylate transport system permease small subunit
LRRNLHLGIDYYYQKFSVGAKKGIDIFIYILILFFSFLLLYFGYIMMELTKLQMSTILRIPMSYMYAVLPVTGFFFFIYSFYSLILKFK